MKEIHSHYSWSTLFGGVLAWWAMIVQCQLEAYLVVVYWQWCLCIGGVAGTCSLWTGGGVAGACGLLVWLMFVHWWHSLWTGDGVAGVAGVAGGLVVLVYLVQLVQLVGNTEAGIRRRSSPPHAAPTIAEEFTTYFHKIVRVFVDLDEDISVCL